MPRCPKIIGIVSHALCAVFFFVFFVPAVNADATPSATPTPATSSAIVTATVPEQAFNPPILIDPSNNSVTNNPREPFSWKRPSPLPATPLDHYDFYLDGELFAQGISDSLTTQDYYFYSISRENDVFKLNLKTNMSDGYHHWRVVAYNTSGLSSSSETWTFYVDTQNPNIKLISVDTNTLNWDSAHPETIPTVDQRYLYVTNSPLLTGTVEPYANLQFTLLCPPNVPNCSSLTQSFIYPSGNWQHRFYNLIPNKTYTVYLAATDSAGNHVFFPPFYLIFISGPSGTVVTPTPTPQPTATPAPSPSLVLPSPTGIIVPPTLTEIFIPAEFIPVPPATPPPPPEVVPPPPSPSRFNYLYLILLLLLLGLPLHLAMAQYGTNTNIEYSLLFQMSLLFPFIHRKQFKTHPFTTIVFYDTKITYQPWQVVVTDINGQYHLKQNKPEELFIKSSCIKRNFNPAIIKSSLLPNICLFSQPKDHENRVERLQQFIFRKRSLPLALAVLTSSIVMFILPSYFVLIYLYLSLQAAFSEYLYPKLES